MDFRLATANDVPAIVRIYNQAIARGFETAATEAVTVAQRLDWLQAHQESRYPIYVVEQDQQVVAWLSFSAYRPGRAALQGVAEISYYVDGSHFRQGIGRQLMAFAIDEGRRLGFRDLLAIVLDPNRASIRLLEKFGFEQWAHLPNVAHFGGGSCSHVFYGLKL